MRCGTRRSGRGACHPPTCAHTVSSTQSPIGTISPVLSAIGMNSDGGTSPRSGCRHRMSASTPDDARRREVVDRLVLEEQLVVLDRVAQRLFGLDAADGPRPDLLVEHRDAVAAVRLGVVHRGVGLVQHGLGVDVRGARRNGQPDARGHDDLAAVDRRTVGADRRRSRARCRPRRRRRRRRAARRRTRRRPSGPRCRRRGARPRPLRDLDEQLVAGGVAERVVDRLEPVEVDEQHRGAQAVAARRWRTSGSGGRPPAPGSAGRSAGRAAPGTRAPARRCGVR